MARDEQGLRDYAERVSAFLINAGFPRMPARVVMTLTVAQTDGLTAGELAERLGASPAAISGAVRYLQTVAMIRRVSQPGSRRDLYELPEDAWYTASMSTNPMYAQIIALSAAGVAAAGEPGDLAYDRISTMNTFFEFVQRRLPELLEEWKAQDAPRLRQEF